MSNDKIIVLGKWHTEYDKDGNLIKTVYSDSYQKLFGNVTELNDSDSYKNWVETIHPDDFQRVADSYKEALKKNPENTDYDIEYRKMTEWGFRWFHDYGHYTRYEDGSLKCCDGIIFDINDAKTMNANTGTLPISHDLLKESKIGLWAFELDEGCPPRMYGDEAMMMLIGVDGPATPEEVYHAWYDHIDKNHYDEVHAAIDKMSVGIHAEVQYPWHSEDGQTYIVRCGGVRNPRYTKGLRIEGVHHDVTDISHYEKEKELQERIQESEKIIESFVNSCNIVYKVNLADDSFSALRKDKNMIGYGKKFKTFSQALEFFLSDVVFEPDREEMRQEVDFKNIRKKLAETPSYSVEYRVLIDKTTIWHNMTINALGEDQIVIGFTPKNRDILFKKILSKINTDFYALFSIDLDTELLTVLKNAPWYTLVREGLSMGLSKALKFFLKDVTGDAKIFFEQFVDSNQLRSIFTKEEKRSFTYLSSILRKWINASIYVIERHGDGSPAVISLGFSFVDSFESEKQKLQDLLKENMEIIGGFTSEYLALYYINLKEGLFKVYAVDGKILPDTKLLLTQSTDPFELIHKFANSPAVHPDDRHLFEGLTREKAKELLKDKKKYSLRYRRDYGHGYKWSVMDAIKSEKENEEAENISVGFAECDNEIRREQALINSLAILSNDNLPDDAIKEQLSLLGNFYGADRAFIFEYGKGKKFIHNSYEWCSENAVPLKDLFQEVPVEYIDTWLEDLKKKGVFHVSSTKDNSQISADFANFLDKYGINSIIVVPLMKGNEFEGLIGVDNPTLVTDNIDLLKTAAAIAFSEILKRKEDDEEHITLSKLTDAFLSVYYVDLATDYMRTWKIDQNYQKDYGITKSYSESMGGYVQNHVAKRDQKRCIKMTSPEYILEQFKTKDRFSIEITDTYTGVEINGVFDYIKVSEDGNKFVICCKDVTESVQRQKEQQAMLEKALSEAQEANSQITHQKRLLDYFMQSYTSAYSVDLTNDSFEILHMNEKFAPTIPRNGTKTDMNKFICEHIHVEDREMMMEMSDKDYVINRLRTESYYTFTVREVFGRTTKNMRVLVVRGIDEYHIALGFMDITEELRKEREQQERLQEALSMAQSANRAKTTFLNNMSHDIRTPMNAIIGYTGLATSHIENKEQVKDYLGKIGQASNHLLSLINDVLDMSRIESGKMNIEEKDESLLEIIQILKSIIQSDINSKQLDFHVDIVNVTDENILCDKLRLNQVLLNILSNAIKYTQRGGSISMQVMETDTDQNFGTYVFRIKDNGMGMSKEFLDTIYEPFTRVRSSTVSGIQGTGLGMAITKNIVDMMGGSIEIESEINKGTEVILTFDFKIMEAPKEQDASQNDIRFNGKKVLLVEDNEFNREIATELLKEFGFEVSCAEYGNIAVDIITNAKKGDFDLILMDIQMPYMDGYEATKHIRALDTEISKIPIVAMTANAFEEDRKMALEAGMDDHITKPIDIDELKETLARIVKSEE